MPKIVEMIGPSGSGKSTIYHSLKNEWKYEFSWVTYDQIKYSNKSVYSQILQKVKILINKLLAGEDSKKRKTKVISEWGFIAHNNETFLGEKYLDFKSAVMDIVDEHCRVGYNGEDKRFITIYMIMWSIAFIETIKSIRNDERYCILREGEGLISRIMHLNSPTFDESALKSYFKHIPFPDVLIFLDIDPETTLKRVMTRDRLSTLHNGMNEEKILTYTKSTYNLLSKAAYFAEEAGTDVYRLDVSQPVELTVEKIKKILS